MLLKTLKRTFKKAGSHETPQVERFATKHTSYITMEGSQRFPLFYANSNNMAKEKKYFYNKTFSNRI